MRQHGSAEDLSVFKNITEGTALKKLDSHYPQVDHRLTKSQPETNAPINPLPYYLLILTSL